MIKRKINPEKLKSEISRALSQLPSGDSIEHKRIALKQWHVDFIKATFLKKPYLLSNEDYYLSMIQQGDNFNPKKIIPELVLCSNREDYDIYDYVRMWSSFPTQDRAGRRIKFLIRDSGHPGNPIMGICCLSSPVRQLNVRDEWIGWRGNQWREVRAKNLAYIMDISTCIGVPPYSYLTSGKLLCYMMLSNEVRELYRLRYLDKLSEIRERILTDIVLLTTTGAFSRNSPQYKGISFDGEQWFKFLGYTKGYSTFQISPALYDKIKRFLINLGKPYIFSINGGANAKLRMLRCVARELRIDEERLVFSSHRRAIYAAPLASNWREFLHGETNTIRYYDLPMKELIEKWRNQWLTKRLSSDKVLNEVKSFEPKQFRLSDLLMQGGLPDEKAGIGNNPHNKYGLSIFKA